MQDAMELLNIRNNLTGAAERAGAQCIGTGFGFGAADAMLVGQDEDASITVLVFAPDRIELFIREPDQTEGVTVEYGSEAEAETGLLGALPVLSVPA